jgi:uncharacterized OsmC-like protein
MTSKVTYLGDLRTSSIHLQSGTEILSDAPTDNHGRGEAFSPTDLAATAYASCMITIIGIYCDTHGLHFNHAKAQVQKIMGSNPRRISKVVIEMDLSGNNWSDTEAEKAIRAGKNCPVAKTFSEDVEIEFSFSY